ncbi:MULTISPECIES: MATE family efflux transporter [unclassified Sporosarcina]|uniref:MATE family efflux transporter n=1 Tax=unclassified Sporosarcina TaxID=2647733 RepID=UPI000C16FA3C|nr:MULTISPECIES: MATE family efflux transporter [unclassified Sporosarcina]PID06024.1 MATE family efflux transporter [Sporosarcina sp. P30]PID09218.1 MATE family efflux transporter [Sporosarcina sp. P31]PID12516.1 MATE family efflux transporter [Sporosarcina sp. P32b]
MKTNVYESQSINRLILTFSIPAIFSLLIEMMTAVVDTSFAGHLGSQSESALTAMGLLSPLMAVFVALQTLFAISTAIMISTYLGRNDKTKLNNYFQSGFIMTIVVSASTSFLVYSFMHSILSMLGAEVEVYELAQDYLRIILISNIFSAVGYTLTSVIRAFGNPKAEAVIIVLSVVINVVGNAILTFGLQLGMVGIALGTLLSEVVCALLAVIYLVKNDNWFTSNPISPKAFIAMSYNMLKIGFAQTTIQLLAGVTAFIVNYQLLTVGGNAHIAMWNIANKMYMLLLMPIIGITQAVQTIIAYFNGKGDEDKKLVVVKKTVQYCFFYGIGITAIVFLVGKYILVLFTGDQAIIDSVMSIIQVIFITFPILGVTYTIMTLLQVTGSEMKAVIIGVTRQVVSVIPLVMILPTIFEKYDIFTISPSFSIFFAIPLADILTLGMALFFFNTARSVPSEER